MGTFDIFQQEHLDILRKLLVEVEAAPRSRTTQLMIAGINDRILELTDVKQYLRQKLDGMNTYFESSYDEDYTFSELSPIFEKHGYRLTSRCTYVDPYSNRGTYTYYTVPALEEEQK